METVTGCLGNVPRPGFHGLLCRPSRGILRSAKAATVSSYTDLGGVGGDLILIITLGGVGRGEIKKAVFRAYVGLIWEDLGPTPLRTFLRCRVSQSLWLQVLDNTYFGYSGLPRTPASTVGIPWPQRPFMTGLKTSVDRVLEP